MALVELREEFEGALKADLVRIQEEMKLCAAIEYALLSGGKRFRPIIVLGIAKSLGKGLDVAPAALAVEYFHTASLIADDLPCMDDDATRRGRDALHCAFGESTALLASYALICRAFEMVHENATFCGAERGMICLDQAAKAAGLAGATGGQFLDLFPPDQTPDTLLSILNRKTVTLFETAFVMGWVFGGGDLEKLDLVKQAAMHFGMAFQIGDDLDDLGQDDFREQTSNYALAIGKEAAQKSFEEHLSAFDKRIDELELTNSDLAHLKGLMVDHLASASSA